VIIDEFDLTALATSIRGLVDTYGAIRIVPSDTGRAGLWSAMYGYRLALAGPGADPSTIEVPHGHLVAIHALANLGSNARITDVVLVDHPWHTFERAILTVEVDWDRENVLEVHLVGVDLSDLDEIGRALNFYKSERADSIVTSWGFVDCALADRYGTNAGSGSPSARTIVEFWEEALVASEGAETLLVQLCEAFIVPIRLAMGDGFQCRDPEALVGLGTIVLIADVAARSAFEIGWDPGGNSRYFASAGNQGLSIPMPPAAWPGVYGVEACIAPSYPAPSQLRAAFSNVGGVGDQPQVRALGAWFEVPVRAVGHPGGGPPRLGYWGTSYAAPTAAVIASTMPRMGTPFFFDPCASP
jgi:hypothetical protein